MLLGKCYTLSEAPSILKETFKKMDFEWMPSLDIVNHFVLNSHSGLSRLVSLIVQLIKFALKKTKRESTHEKAWYRWTLRMWLSTMRSKHISKEKRSNWWVWNSLILHTGHEPLSEYLYSNIPTEIVNMQWQNCKQVVVSEQLTISILVGRTVLYCKATVLRLNTTIAFKFHFSISRNVNDGAANNSVCFTKLVTVSCSSSPNLNFLSQLQPINPLVSPIIAHNT